LHGVELKSDRPATDVLGYVWPRRTRCPECSDEGWVKAGRGKCGVLLYRRCTACAAVYKVLPIAEHVDRGGDQSELRVY
jgi:hypothetical protein